MIIGAEVHEDSKSLLISYYNELGKIDYISKRLSDHELFNWVESSTPTSTKSWNGKYVKKAPSKGKYLSAPRIQELLMEKLSSDELEKIYSFDNYPKKHYLDIEIKLLDETFPDPERARMPVGMISFCNEDNNIYVLSIMTSDDMPDGLSSDDIIKMEKEVNDYFKKIIPLRPEDKKLFEKDFKVKYMFFKTEQELLEFYFHKILPKTSFITGWNVTDFDWKYLMNRSSNMKVDSLLNMSSRSTSTKNKIPLHLGILDYMVVFEKLKPYKVVENYKLDYIANLVLGTSKLKHDYPTMLAFQKDTYLFTMYNIIDVILVKLIEDKLSLLEVTYSIANVSQVEVNRVFTPVYVTETLMCREFLNKNLKMPKLDYVDKSNESGTYAGAYVKDPIPGYYNYVSCYDFKSMYPNIQIQWNIGPDTYLGKTDKVKLKGGEINTKNDTLFRSDTDSVARIILTRLYDERIKTQGEMKKLKKKKING